MYHSNKKKSPLSPLKNYLTLKASSQYSSFFVKIFRELYFRSSSLYCSAQAYYITEVLLKLVTQSNGHRTRQKKKRTEQRLGQNIMKPKLCLALALFSLVVICQAIPEEVDSGFISLFCYYTLGKIGTQHYLCFPFC